MAKFPVDAPKRQVIKALEKGIDPPRGEGEN